LGGKPGDVATQYSFGGVIEALIDEERGMEVKGPGKKRVYELEGRVINALRPITPMTGPQRRW